MSEQSKKSWRDADWIPRSLREWWQVRRLEKHLTELEAEYLPQLEIAKESDHQYILSTWDSRAEWPQAMLGRIKTAQVDRRAKRRGIVLDDEPGWWTTHDESGTRYLTDLGLMRARRIIKDDFRQSVKWWVDILAPLIAAMTGLGGVIIGILSLWRSN